MSSSTSSSLSSSSTDGHGTVASSILFAIQQVVDVDVGSDNTFGPFKVETIERAVQEMKDAKFDLNKGIDDEQRNIVGWWCSVEVTPMIFFSDKGDVGMVLLLLLLGASGTKLAGYNSWFPMYAAARGGHLQVLQLLYECGGDAKYDINKENCNGTTPLGESIYSDEIETSCWVVLNGGGQNLSERAIDRLRDYCRVYEAGRELMLWVEGNIQFHDTFVQIILCGTIILRTPSSASASAFVSASCCNTASKTRKEQEQERDQSLPLLNGQPGVMELIGDYTGLRKGKDLRMLQEFDVLMNAN